MRKYIFILVISCLFFSFEYLIYNIVSPLFVPNLLLLSVIFFTLSMGIPMGFFAAGVAGVISDSFSIGPFGGHTVSLMLSVGVVQVLEKYVYHRGSRSSRVLLVFFVSIAYIGIHYLIQLIFGNLNFIEALRKVFIPEIVITLLFTNYIFDYLKSCVSKYYV